MKTPNNSPAPPATTAAGRGLTPKQAKFVDEYLVDLNASAAARRAGYAERRADQQGFENLRKPEIAAAIAARRVELQVETHITQRMVIDGLRREAEFTGEGSSHAARVAAWAWLGKHLGIFEERITHSVGIPAEDWQALLRPMGG